MALTAVLGISGCANRAGMLGDAPAPALRLSTIEETAPAAAPAEPPPAPRVVPVAETSAASDIVVASQPSAWCEYLKEDAAADATVLRAPTMSGQIDDQNKGSVSLGLSLSGLQKANLLEQSAEARCRSHQAEQGLQKVVFLAPQTLSAAGFRAKADAIARRAAELDRLKAKIVKEKKAGNLTADKASSLSALIEQLYSAAAEARSEADRRSAADGMLTGPAAAYTSELLRAEADLADIGSRMRTADAYDVSVIAGYSDGNTADGLDSMSDGFSGKVKFSLKLGAFAPDRYEHERRAKEARLAAIRDQEGGALWQIRTLREAHQKAISGLEEQRVRLDRAMAQTQSLLAVLNATPEPEFAGSTIEARLRLISLESDRAAVVGSLAEIRSKLNQLGPG